MTFFIYIFSKNDVPVFYHFLVYALGRTENAVLSCFYVHVEYIATEHISITFVEIIRGFQSLQITDCQS